MFLAFLPAEQLLVPALLGFGFGSGWMLWFLGAAIAPIIIHLWNKRRHLEIRWAAMEYLLAAIRNNSRRITLEQLILLLIRTLLVVLLIVAVAEPFLDLDESWAGVFWPALIGLIALPCLLWLAVFSTRTWRFRSLGIALLLIFAALPLLFLDFSQIDPFNPSASASRRTHRIIVIDGSYSMAYKPSDESRFERAQALIRRIVEESRLGDGFTLIVMAEPPRVVIGTPVFEKADFLDEIEKLRLIHGGGDLLATLGRVEEVLHTARRDHPKLVRHEVHILSDLGQTSWNLNSSAAQDELRQKASRLHELAGLVVYDVGQPGAVNLAITDARLTRSGSDAEVKFATLRRAVKIKFNVRNYGAGEQLQKVVELWVDGRRTNSTTLDVPGNGQASGRFDYPFDVVGEHYVELRLAGDSLDVDNRRWISVPVKRRIKVLCIDGKPSRDIFASATGYLLQALRGSPNASEGEILAESATERALRERNLADYDAIFLCNVAQFNREEAAALYKFVSRGGGLICFLGERVQPENYNWWLGGKNQHVPRVLPAMLKTGPGAIVDRRALDAEGTFIAEFEHEIVRVFHGKPDVRFASTPINKWYKLWIEKNESSGEQTSLAQVALRFINRDPAIIEERIGRGRSILVATSADLGPVDDYWTYMPTLQNFLPLVREMLAASVVGPYERRNLIVGEAASGTTGLLDASARVSMKTPWNSTEHIPIRPLHDHGRWTYADTNQSGIYSARVPEAKPREVVFAVNVDTHESDLSKVEEDELTDEIFSGVKFKYLTRWQGLDNSPAAAGVQRRFFDVWLLGAVCCLLLLDSFLAWLFGRHGS